MLTTDFLSQLQRDALREAIQSPTHSLVRTGNGFIAPHKRGDNAANIPKFTRRLINKLDRDGLVHIDDRDCPSEVTLNAHGIALAEQLRAEQGKGGLQ